jgi:hypothetical protein
MSSLALFIARTAAAVWVGAAILFVVVSIREVTCAEFDTVTKDQLVALRFPLYYDFGFALIGAGLMGTLAAADGRWLSPRRRWATAVLLLGALGILAADYFLVFSRLMTMIQPPGQTRPADFVTLHKLSMWVNFAQLALCAGAVAALNWPAKPPA